MSRRVRFLRNYDHRWPSRAVTRFRADGGPAGDGVYTVKAEVREAAIAAGVATSVDDRATATGGGKTSRCESPGRMAGLDPHADRDDARRDELEPDDCAGRGDELSGVSGSVE